VLEALENKFLKRNEHNSGDAEQCIWSGKKERVHLCNKEWKNTWSFSTWHSPLHLLTYLLIYLLNYLITYLLIY